MEMRENVKGVILADGGALSDFNERLGHEDPSKRKDFVKVPEQVIEELRKDFGDVHCPPDSRLFCNVGSEKAQGFHAKLASVWNVRSFPLSFARYERADGAQDERHAFRIRFHAYIAYALGVIAGSKTASGAADTVVAILSDDPHLIPCISDARRRGLDVRLVWWESGLSDEVQYLAARNNVEPMLLPNMEELRAPPTRKDRGLDSLFASSNRARGRFRLVALDEGGAAGSAQHQRLVCRIRGGGKLAIWGQTSNHKNIDAVKKAGLPCTVECEYQAPGDEQAERFGHTHWVPHDWHLEVVK